MKTQENNTDMELQYGRCITRAGDTLHPVRLSQLYRGIHNPKQHFKDQITRLRSVKAISPDRYRQLKKDLPYFVCGGFQPKVRRRENFTGIRCFLLDLDYLAGAEINKEHLFEKLRAIPEVKMLFTSPSNDGLKVLFLLKKLCTDSALFSTFYKIFAARFAQNHNLLEVTDIKTSDVTRACFMSYDPDAYFAAAAVPINMDDYLRANDYGAAEKELQQLKEEEVRLPQKKVDTAPSSEVLLRIKQKLNPQYKKPKKKDWFVPPQVEEAVELLREKLREFEMELTETEPISYGRKLRVRTDNLWAEINIFYGKKGYSIVRTTKSGSNEELGILATKVIEEILFSRQKRKN